MTRMSALRSKTRKLPGFSVSLELQKSLRKSGFDAHLGPSRTGRAQPARFASWPVSASLTVPADRRCWRHGRRDLSTRRHRSATVQVRGHRVETWFRFGIVVNGNRGPGDPRRIVTGVTEGGSRAISRPHCRLCCARVLRVRQRPLSPSAGLSRACRRATADRLHVARRDHPATEKDDGFKGVGGDRAGACHRPQARSVTAGRAQLKAYCALAP